MCVLNDIKNLFIRWWFAVRSFNYCMAFDAENNATTVRF